jgi:NAD(P)H-hydrate epimerase
MVADGQIPWGRIPMIEALEFTHSDTSKVLLTTEKSRALDIEAQGEWGFNVFSLIEAAGRLCAGKIMIASGRLFKNKPRIIAAVGKGNNGADAMVMLRFWILSSCTTASSSAVILSRLPNEGENGPWVEILTSLKKINVPLYVWNENDKITEVMFHSDIILDGIAGTGISGSLNGSSLEMVNAINSIKEKTSSSMLNNRPVVVSVDIPSGSSDEWKPQMPIIKADITLAIEPEKICIYKPLLRPFAGDILPVSGVFPKELIARYKGHELIKWENANKRIPKIKPDSYKYERGIVEIRAGSQGASGAAFIAARGAQAAGAGLVRLVVDDDIYQTLASRSSGIMASPASLETTDFSGRFAPDAILLGPGWCNAASAIKDREKILHNAIAKKNSSLILDADAIGLSKGLLFNGKTILTPHPGELAKFAGIEKEEILNDPLPIILKCSREYNCVILFKSHVIFVAGPGGKLAVIDGMKASLAAGGTGDLLAGFCAAIAARMIRQQSFDAYDCAVAAAALLIESGGTREFRNRFYDPAELADKAACLAGEAWL